MTRIAIANGATPVERIRFVRALAERGITLTKPAPRKHFFTTDAGTHALCTALFALGHGWTFAANGDVYATLLPARADSRSGSRPARAPATARGR